MCQSSRPIIIEQKGLIYIRKFIIQSVLLADVRTRVFKKMTVAELAKLKTEPDVIGSIYHKRQNSLVLSINPLNPELNPICCLLEFLGTNHFLHVSRIRVKSLTLRLLMSYIYGAPILYVSRSHTTTQHSR